MIGEMGYQPEAPVDQDAKMAQDFKNFIDVNKFTAEQMRKAYDIVMGIAEKEEVDEAVEKIAEKMNEMLEKDFPLNYLAQLVGSKENYEQAVPRFFEFIEGLEISPKEKKMFNSIVEKKRAGDVVVLVDGDEFSSFSIKKSDGSQERLAEELIQSLQLIIAKVPTGKKFGFMFTEK